MNLNLQRSFSILLTLLSTTALADSHFYLGGSIGAVGLIDKEKTNNPIVDIHHLSTAGILGGPLLGYEFMHDRWKLGIEGFFNGTGLKLYANQNYAPQASYQVKMFYNTGIRILPSYELTPKTSGHIILGYSNASFHIKDNGNFGLISNRFSKNGFQSGLGLRTCLSNHFFNTYRFTLHLLSIAKFKWHNYNYSTYKASLS